MLFRRSLKYLSSKQLGDFSFLERGQFFPIRYRYIDYSLKPGVKQNQAEIQARFQHKRSSFVTGEVRQTTVSPYSSLDSTDLSSISQIMPPSHFIALRLPQSSPFMANMSALYEDIRDTNDAESKLLIPLKKMHVTLSVFSITDPSSKGDNMHLKSDRKGSISKIGQKRSERGGELAEKEKRTRKEEAEIDENIADLFKEEKQMIDLSTVAKSSPTASTTATDAIKAKDLTLTPVKKGVDEKGADIRKDIDKDSNIETVQSPLSLTKEVDSLVFPDLVNTVADKIGEIIKRSNINQITLRFNGLGSFNKGRVVFAKVHAERDFPALDGLVRSIRDALGNELRLDVKGNPNDSFIPHVTIAKIRPYGNTSHRRAYGREVPRTMWVPHQYREFGEATINTIDLCEMKTDEKTRYYKIVRSYTLH